MRPLELDFIARRPFGNLAGMLLLLAGIGACAVTALDAADWADLEQNLQARKAAETRRLRGGPNRPLTSQVPRPEDVRAVREAAILAARLTLPWQRLFDDTAGAAGEGVALTGLQPDAAARVLRVSGLARDLPAAYGFVERLLAKPGIANAYLAQHDLQRKDPEAALGFVVLATWQEEPR